MRSGVRWLAVGLLSLGLAGCDGFGWAPQDTRPGWRLPYPEVEEPVADWGFAAGVEEVALETSAPWGWHSVTVWCGVLDGRLFVATDDAGEAKRWVSGLEAQARLRIGIEGRTYPVLSRRISDPALWDGVVGAFRRKYGERYERYDFPKPGDLASGRIYELVSQPL
jgi:hypothetical protein